MCEFISYIANNEKLRFDDFMEFCPVYAYEDDRELFGLSENQKEIFVDLVKATLNSLHLPVNVSQSLELPRVRGEYIHAFLDEYALDSNGEIETLLLSSVRCKEDEKKAIAIMKEFAVTPERFEKFITALSNHFLAMNSRNTGFAKALLSCYQFGQISACGELIELPTLQNAEKAEAFAQKYGMELLTEPFETNIIWRK